MDLILFSDLGDFEIKDVTRFSTHFLTGNLTFVTAGKRYSLHCIDATFIKSDLYAEVETQEFHKFLSEYVLNTSDWQEAVAAFAESLKNNPDFFSDIVSRCAELHRKEKI